ncbi:FDXHR family putative zinc-binding protein [Tessaracoccus sp. Y36]
MRECFTCRKCGKAWRGSRAQHCPACHETFGGAYTADRHRIGRHGVHRGPKRRRCKTPREMESNGFHQRHGKWVRSVSQSLALRTTNGDGGAEMGAPTLGRRNNPVSAGRSQPTSGSRCHGSER